MGAESCAVAAVLNNKSLIFVHHLSSRRPSSFKFLADIEAMDHTPVIICISDIPEAVSSQFVDTYSCKIKFVRPSTLFSNALALITSSILWCKSIGKS